MSLMMISRSFVLTDEVVIILIEFMLAFIFLIELEIPNSVVLENKFFKYLYIMEKILAAKILENYSKKSLISVVCGRIKGIK